CIYSYFSRVISTLSVTRYSIPEEMERGSVVANLAADLGLEVGVLAHREVKLEMFQESNKYLDVNKKTGELYIVEQMDREYLCPSKTATTCFVKLDVIIESPLRIFNIELEIKDINDNAPHFRRDRVELDVSESATPGERFSLPNAVDPDGGINTVKMYKLSESEHFTIEIQTGSDGTKYVDMVLTKALDREENAVHHLILTAVDGGVPARSGTANIIVRVLDTNDNAPRFDHPVYSVNMTENSPIGTLVMKLNATDLDEGPNAEIKYSFTLYTSEKTQDVFALNPNTGEITVKGTIDYEDMKFYELHVEAKDKGQHPLLGDTMHLDIAESTPAGERFSLNNAVDPDIGTNSIKTYYLSESEHFNIEIQTGRDGSKFTDLILKKALDREEQSVHNLILTAVDGGVPSRTGTANIIVRVLDTNDNAPKFDRESYNIDIMENSPIGRLVVKLNATDLDVGSNSEIVYSFSLYTSEKTQETFNLNPNTGEITVKDMINYEDFRIYDMEVIATDKGTHFLSGHCKLTILVTDMNDNHPELSIKSFQSPIKEDIAVDTVIAVVSVSDKDSGENGKVDIHIADQLPFALRESSDNYYELVVSEPLDREKVPEYEITFTVTDRGSPPLSDNETMTLELLDVNDNVPQFPQSFYTIPVMENNAPGALLSSLTAFDPDLHENQYLVYFIIEKEIVNTSMSMLFSINPENGNLYALKTFDYEIEKEFLFHIETRDSGVPPLNSNVTVHIIIVDQNDNPPVIVSPWRAHGSVVEEKIPRSTDKGSLVSKVIAIDTDSVQNSRITYQFLQVTDATLFSLDQYNGEIRTMRMFSYRDARHQRLVVIAKDNGDPALSATVTIKLSTVETAVKAYSDMTEVPLEYDIFSDLNLYLVIGLGSVSFLLLITILVTCTLCPSTLEKVRVSFSSILCHHEHVVCCYPLFYSRRNGGRLCCC
uniref:Cadherin domain-containing protein n=1 Tax=Hucho hucho TaxID=62062 RepID=A0A4W5NQH7_9TELE